MNYLKIYDNICASGKKVENQRSASQRDDLLWLSPDKRLGAPVDESSLVECGLDRPRRSADDLHRHLIIPAGIWGSTSSHENVVYLNTHQQLVAYKCLVRIYPHAKHIRTTLRKLISSYHRPVPSLISSKRRSAAMKKATRRPHSAETRAKMSASHMGKVFTEESRLKMSEAKRGRKMSAEHVKNRSESRKRNGRGFSDESKEKMRQAALNRRGKVKVKVIGGDSVHTMVKTNGWSVGR